MENYPNNSKKLPTLLDMALSYEDGYERYIQPLEDGYLKTYGSLSDDEKNFIKKHPYVAYKFNKNAEKARVVGRRFGGTSDGYGDAVRHCYWCALNQKDAGLNSSLAKEFGDAHENKPDNKAKAMDLYNNDVGYYLGKQAIINGWNEEEILNQVINAADNGKLKIAL